ncbi:hypothetical protein [Nocardioides sp. NPDC127503]|uniref:hypothetical protein n=1 Tax=Nocardioides sp. NPDC127503 TaxID=3154516 RepID=UPI00331DF209
MEVDGDLENLPWCIDAWAVHDGKVFASRRRPGSMNAAATVFMAVPDLEPVPVGRISTALRATRSGFQAGLLDRDEQDVAFGSLRQVRELVRLAYLAGGMGPEAPGAIAGALGGPPAEGGPGGAYLEEQPAFQVWSAEGPLELVEEPTELARAVMFLAFATVLEWESRLSWTGNSPAEVRAMVGWASRLMCSGVIDGGRRNGVVWSGDWLHDLADHHGGPFLQEATSLVREELPELRAFSPLETVGGTWSRSHLAAVPLPRWAGFDHRARRLVDLHLLPLVDRTWWLRDLTALDIAPLVLVNVVQGQSRVGWLPGEPPAVDAAWLHIRRELVWEELPEVAEEALRGFIHNCLTSESPLHPEPHGQALRAAVRG